MELNEVTEKLPLHLLQFAVDQPYNSYTAVDQAVWRYVMRQNYHHLRKVAHSSYVEGLKKTGVEIENIPTMYGMNRILKEIGWAAVAVDGFIPPGAFMEFTKYNVLVIAADIRMLEQIEYTPAPDIIHESAGHAPIIAEPEFAEYLKYIGEVGSKAFSSKKDFELYEAIRHLSIIKGDPNTKESEIAQAEKEIETIQSNMGAPSEMALIRNLHWWTVEYGLIGTPDNFKLYGAGLLSSIGESKDCFQPTVKKIPYSIQAAYTNYDITKHQPQLFVTPDFKYLHLVLEEFINTMAWKKGGLEGINKAIYSEHTGTIVYGSGLQISGTFSKLLSDTSGNPIFFKTKGPTALAVDNKQLKGFDKLRFKNGFSSPIGKLKNSSKPIEFLSESELASAGFVIGEKTELELESGLLIKGKTEEIIRNSEQKIILIKFVDFKIYYENKLLEQKETYFMAVGESIVSAFAGPADVEAFQPTVLVPKEKTHKIVYDEKTLRLQALYKKVREIREGNFNFQELESIFKKVVEDHPDDWLLPLEIYEIMEMNKIYPDLSNRIKEYLEEKKEKRTDLKKLITDGLELVKINL